MTILEVIIAAVLVVLFMLFIIAIKISACEGCQHKHRCNDLMQHNQPNLCEQNELMNNWHKPHQCL